MKKHTNSLSAATDLSVIDGEYTDITGEGKGGGGHTPVELPNAITASQRLRILIAASEGEIEDVPEIYFNGVPSSSFKSVHWEFRPGTPSQTYINGFDSIYSPGTHTAVELSYNNTNYIRSIDSSAQAAKIILTIGSLFVVTEDGDMVGNEVNFDFYTRPNASATWTKVQSARVALKSTIAFSVDYRVDAPAGVVPGTPWQLRVMRASPNDPDSHYHSTTSWTGLTEIQEKTLTYPNTALVGITFKDAAVFGGSVPELALRLKGIKCRIPNNYNPTTRVYTGTWNLGWALANAYTDNPVWHLFTVLTNSRFGLGIADADIDTTSFYTAAQYADQLVSYTLDGAAKTEPRYTMHNQFMSREDVPTFLGYFLNIINGNFSTNAFGQLTLILDRAGLPVTHLVTKSNVIEGLFDYSSSDLETRFSVANVTYNDGRNLGKTDTVTVEDATLAARYGYQTTDIALVGCMSEAQAIRKARWALYTNGITTGIVSFKVLAEGMLYRIGELIKVMDDDNAMVAQQARLKSHTPGGTTTIVMDRQLTFAAATYVVHMVDVDGKTMRTVNKTFATSTTTDTFTVTGSFTLAPGSVIAFSGSVALQTYRIIGIKKDEMEYTISALEHDEAKYAYIEGSTAITVPTGDFLPVSATGITPATNLQFSFIASSNGVATVSNLHITWDWTPASTDVFDPTFTVMWRRDNQDFVTVPGIVTKNLDIPEPSPGTYEVYVYAVNVVSQVKSLALSGTYPFRVTAGASSLQPPLSAWVQGTTGVAYNTPDLVVDIRHNPANNDTPDKVSDYIVEVWTADGVTKKRVYVTKIDGDRNALFMLSNSENIQIFGTATRNVQLKIYARDTVGDLSSPLVNTYTNAVPAVVTFALTATLGGITVKITPPADNDIAGYLIYRSTTAGFTPGAGNLFYDGPDTSVFAAGVNATQYFFRVAAYDTFQKSSLSVSGEQNATTLTENPDTFTYTGLAFKPNDSAINRVSWTAGTASKNGGAPVTINANAVGALWSSGNMYIYYVPGNSTLQTNTNLATAIAAGGRILAVYKGGTDLQVGDGKAFISGDQLLAGTVGAAALVTNTAVITGSAQIANAVITNAHILSLDASKITSGLIVAGQIDSRGLSIKDGAGNIILSAGVPLDFARVGGTTRPENNANQTYVDANGAIQGVSSGFGLVIDNEKVQVGGTNLLKLASASAAELLSGGRSGWGFNLLTLNAAKSFSGLVLRQNTSYTISFIAWCDSGTVTLQNDLFPDTLPQSSFTLTTTPQRFSWTLSSASADMLSCSIRWWNGTGGILAHVTDMKLEEGNKATTWFPAPDDLKTVYSSTAPLAVDGRVWVDTSSGTNVVRVATGGAFVLSSTVGAPAGTNVGATPATTVEGNAANGQTAFNGTTKYRTAGAPSNNPVPTGLTIVTNTNATINIRVDWAAYVQGARTADMLLLFWNKTTTAPTINDSALAFNVNAGASYHIFEGVNPADTYSFGIAAARKTESGLEVGTIVAPSSAPDWLGISGGTPNFTANVAGTGAATVVTQAANGQTAATGTTNYRNNVAPTNNAAFGALTQTATADGNILVNVPYTYSQGAVAADLLYVFVREGGGTVVASNPAMATNAVSGSINFYLKPETTYTFGLQAVRRTESGLVGTSILTSSSITTLTSSFSGNIGGIPAGDISYHTDAVSGGNSLRYSEELNNAVWVKVECSVVADSVVGPNGTVVAERIIESAANAQHILLQTCTELPTANSVWCGSGYFKAGEVSWIYLAIRTTQNTYPGGYVNLLTGEIGNVIASPFVFKAIPSQEYPGWFRVIVAADIGNLSTFTTIDLRVFAASANGTTAYAGNPAKGFYAFGMQLNRGKSPGPYIKTTDTIIPARSLLGQTANWGNVFGTGKPEDNATVGAPPGTVVGFSLAEDVETNAAAGQTAFSGTAKYRSTGAPTNNPVPNGITLTTNTNGSLNIRLDWNAYVQGAKQADLLMLFWRRDGNAPTISDAAVTFNVNTAAASYFVLEGVAPDALYSFGIAAARRTESGLEIGTIVAPTSAPDWRGVTSGTPNFIGNINGQSASAVASVTVNFNARNDRLSAAIPVPTISATGTAVDHTNNTDGSTNISFEWAWTGSEPTIDGFMIFVHQDTASTAYNFTTAGATDTNQMYFVDAGKRAFILYGVPANQYYSFGVRAYRQVDPDINASGMILTAIVQPSLAAENPYRPSATVAFAGNVTGTVNGIPAANVNVWSAIIGSGKPEDNATAGADFETNVVNIPYSQIYGTNAATGLGFNPSFNAWAGALPDGWSAWSAVTCTAETSIVRTGKYSARFVQTAGNQGGLQKAVTWATTPLTNLFVAGNFDAYIVAKTSGGSPGIMVDLFTSSDFTTWRRTVVNLPNPAQTGVWQRVPFVAGIQEGDTIYGIRVYVMASYSGMSGGAFVGTVIFDDVQFDFMPRISASNIAAYMAAAAIGSAQIANAAIGNAHIQNAAIDTLQVAGNAVSATYANTDVSLNLSTMSASVYVELLRSASIAPPDGGRLANQQILAQFTCMVDSTSWNSGKTFSARIDYSTNGGSSWTALKSANGVTIPAGGYYPITLISATTPGAGNTNNYLFRVMVAPITAIGTTTVFESDLILIDSYR